ncbi:MAG: AAA family ATPase [Saprospiraceae bacterium]
MINRIKIENFKSIRNLNLELSQINILIGANGAGKSNFINFFKFINNIFDKHLQYYVAEEGGANEIVHFDLKTSDSIVCEIEFDQRNIYYFKLEPNQFGNFFFSKEGTQVKGFQDGLNWDNLPILNGTAESALSDEKDSWFTNMRYHTESLRIYHFQDTTKSAKIRQWCDVGDDQYLREDAGNLASFLYWMNTAEPKSFQKVEMAVRSVAPYFERFDLKPDRINADKIRLEWKEKGSDKYFNAKHLSDGTLRFMALATLLLQPNSPAVIIIDEPELGLHPFAINKLAGLIHKASAQSQIIISTQSVNLIDNFEPEDIITVDRSENQSVFHRQNSEVLKDWLSEYSNISDLWNKNVIGGMP